MTGAGGRPEFATNDVDRGLTVADAITEMIRYEQHRPDFSMAIASAYFNVGGWHLVADALRSVPRVRIMLGAEPQRHTDPVVLRPATQPARRAPRQALEEGLEAQTEILSTERNIVPFTAEARGQIEQLILWLRSEGVEVRRFSQEFLHGKAYLLDDPALGVIAGSSNFTFSGLSRNHELNLGQYSPATIQRVRDWFDELWADADPFDLAAYYEQKVLPAEPWLVFLRMLWEAYGHQVAEDDDALRADPSMRDLLPFQKDGVGRARRIIEKHNGVLIADEVGLGKTYVGGALVKDTVRSRQRVLIVAPKIIRDSVWKPYVDQHHLGGWVDVISYDDLLVQPAPDGKRWRLPVARDPEEYSLVLLDEAHTVRNTDTQRAEQLVEVLKGNPRKQVALLTATPVNNSLGDLHSLLSYFIVHDDEFAEIGIPSLAAHFRRIDKLNPDDLSPEHLFDVLDAVAVRRTRRFVRNHYAGQKIDDSGLTLVFPEPRVRRVDYDLAPVLEGFFADFAHALGADGDDDEPDPFFGGMIPDEGLCTLDAGRLSLAGYTPSRYRVLEEDARQRAAEVQVAGLLRSGLLKRFESSGYAFALTCRRMAETLSGLIEMMDHEGVVASGESLRDWIRVDLDDPVGIEEWRDTADYSPVEDYNHAALRADIANDIELLRGMADTVEAGLDPAADPKLQSLTETLVKVVAEAERDTAARSASGPPDGLTEDEAARDDRKVLVFSYFADTVYYLQDNIELILADERLAGYRGRVAFVTGSRSKIVGHGAAEGSVAQDEGVAGFAPRTGGPRDGSGAPMADDRFDLLVTSDVLAEGVNLQQARNIINFDLPWNPMRLVQRHGRVDRIGSLHRFIFLWCFFPDREMDALLRLETTLHRKLIKAAKSIGQGTVLPGVAASDDVVFNAKRDQIQGLANEENDLFTGAGRASLISGEELRAELRKAVENASLEQRLRELPWGIGSGFVTSDRVPGFVFCGRILDRADEPAFRFVPMPQSLLFGAEGRATLADEEPLAAVTSMEVTEIDGVPVDIITDSLTSLTMANPPERDTPAHLPDEWQALAYKAWAAAQEHIAGVWNQGLDPAAGQDGVPAVLRQAVRHLMEHSTHRNRGDVDAAIKVYRRGQAARVTSIVRSVVRDEELTDRLKTDRLIELVDELGLAAPDSKPKRYPIQPDDVHLIAWMAIVPPERGVDDPEPGHLVAVEGDQRMLDFGRGA